jgi:hypothetical protein
VAYSKVTAEVAAQCKVPLIDLDKFKPRAGAAVRRRQIAAAVLGASRHDNTRFTELGARKMAQLAVSQVIAQKLLTLSEHLA